MSKLSQTLYESLRWQPGFNYQTFEVKRKELVFLFQSFCENLPTFSSHSPLYFTWIPVGKLFILLSFPQADFCSILVCFTTDILSCFRLRLVCFMELFSFFSNVCLHVYQMMNRSVCERAPLLWTHDTSLPHTFIANQCR